MRLLTEFSLEKVVSWPTVVAIRDAGTQFESRYFEGIESERVG